MNGSGRRISSDTAAKISSVAVIAAVVIVGIGSIVALSFFVDMDSGTKYEITITVEDMQICDEREYVYGVVQESGLGQKYYNPESKEFNLDMPSKKANLFASASVLDKTGYTNGYVTTMVQKSGPSESPTPLEGHTITLKITTDETSVDMSFFLMLKGYDTEHSSYVDIYGTEPGDHGVKFNLNLKEKVTEFKFVGNEDSKTTGLLKGKIEVKKV